MEYLFNITLSSPWHTNYMTWPLGTGFRALGLPANIL